MGNLYTLGSIVLVDRTIPAEGSCRRSTGISFAYAGIFITYDRYEKRYCNNTYDGIIIKFYIGRHFSVCVYN